MQIEDCEKGQVGLKEMEAGTGEDDGLHET